MIRIGDTDLKELYEQYAKEVYCYLLRLCGNGQDAEELTAETFYQAVRSIHRFDGSCKIRTWLFQIAKHVWYKELEKRKRKTTPLESVADTLACQEQPEDAIIASDEKMELYSRLQRLDEKTREVMYLRLSGELSFKEIGQILGQSENWARVHYYRGKERMKKDV